MDLQNELEGWQEQEPFLDNLSWPIFLPDEWAKDHGELKRQDFELNEVKLKEYAVEITALRSEIL